MDQVEYFSGCVGYAMINTLFFINYSDKKADKVCN